MPARDHLHKYRRVNLGKRDKPYWVMQCMLPGCTHYIPMKTKESCPSLVGKIALCKKCETPFELDRRALRLAYPVCYDCTEPSNKDSIEKAKKFFASLEGGLANGTDPE